MTREVELLKDDPDVLQIRISAVQKILERKTLPPDMRRFWVGVLKQVHPWAIEKERHNPHGQMT